MFCIEVKIDLYRYLAGNVGVCIFIILNSASLSSHCLLRCYLILGNSYFACVIMPNDGLTCVETIYLWVSVSLFPLGNEKLQITQPL